MKSNFFPETLPPKTKSLLEKLKGVNLLRNFYLSGGTALALQLGHRESEDLDFFTKDEFGTEQLEQSLRKIGELKDAQVEKGTLNTFLMGVQLQFLHYPYNLLEAVIDFDGIALSSVIDIACTKLLTISSRGSKKDFIDLFFILKEHSLESLFEKITEKYQETQYSKTHMIKSLIYFKQADRQPMPKMHKKTTWEEIKRKITLEVKALNL